MRSSTVCTRTPYLPFSIIPANFVSRYHRASVNPDVRECDLNRFTLRFLAQMIMLADTHSHTQKQ